MVADVELTAGCARSALSEAFGPIEVTTPFFGPSERCIYLR